MSRYSRITGWGMYVPERRLTNHDLEQMVDTSDKWIVERTGIRERRIVGPGETTRTMSVAASRRALEVAGIAPSDLDLIIVASSSPDHLLPTVATQIQTDLGADGIPAFALVAGCTGFMYGLATAHQFIVSGAYDRVLVIGAETISKAVNWEDRTTCVLFGDGAGAVVVEASQTPGGLLSFELGADGSNWDALMIPAGGVAHPPDHEMIDKKLYTIRMNGRAVFRFATRVMTEATRRVITEAGLTPEEIDLLIPHQANLRIIEYAAKKLGFPMEKVMVNIHKYGNTSAASIPLALVEALEEGRVKPGDTIVMVGFGAGLTWGAAVWHWQPASPEDEAILVEDWPLPQALQSGLRQVRSRAWNTRVAISEKASLALLPLYAWTHKLRKSVSLPHVPLPKLPTSRKERK